MACILEELEKTLTKQLGSTKNSKEFKDGSTKAKERVAELSALLNNVGDMKKVMKGQINADINTQSKETETISINNKGFNGYVSIKNTAGGKGSINGDAKDEAMRKVADGFVGEISNGRLNNSSSGTSYKALKDNFSGPVSGGSITYYGAKNPSVVMLARNGSFNGKPLNNETKEVIQQYFEEGASFVVGDMPGVDSQFINYLDEIGASYKIYHTDDRPPRIVKTDSAISRHNKVESVEDPEVSTIEIAKDIFAKKHKNLAYGKEVEKLSSAELQDLVKETKDNSVHSHIIGSKEQDEIMYIKFQQVKRAEKESIDNLLSIPEVQELIDTKKVNSYSAYIVNLIDSIKKPNVSYSDTVAFSGDMVKSLMNGTVDVAGGSTDRNGNVKIATDKVPDSEVHRISVDWYLEGTEEGKRIMEMNEDDYNEAMLNNESLDRFVDSKKQELALNLLDAVKNINGVHSLTHEMIHVGSAAFMKENPEHPATKKVMALYIEALENKDWISRAVGNAYWTENVDEFLAEVLSNPLMVKYLNTMTTRHGESIISKSFSTLIDTVLGMLGFKKTDSVYQHVLDGFTAMMEYQYGQMTEETNAKSSTVQDILIKELAKQEADIIVPTETFEQNVNRKIECKE